MAASHAVAVLTNL